MPYKGYKHSEETKRKIAEASRKRIGWKHTAEAKRKMSMTHTGQRRCKHTEETKRQMSAVSTGRKFSIQHKINLSTKLTGRKLSVEHRKKISIASKNRSIEHTRKLAKAHTNPSAKTRKRMSISAINNICNNKTKNFSNTKPERQLKEIFKKNNIKFIHQQPMFDIKHQYAADFYLPDYNCIVEADGTYWHNYPEGNKIDHIRTKEMQEKGYNVLRFWENKIEEKIVLQKLKFESD